MKVFVVVERRADYSRFKPILELMKKDSFFQTFLAVTGICLLERHGRDIDYIREDGFKIDDEIPMFEGISDDSGAGMVRAMARVMDGLVTSLQKAKPDLVLSGFDIGANFAVTVAAAHMNIPVAHIQGGELTGSIDESLRHAMSKFAHIHFPATEDAKNRLVRLGEDPSNIYVVGCPSLDVLLSTPSYPKEELEKEFELDFRKPFALVIQHPVTTENKDSFDQIRETIKALKESKIQAMFLLPNNDAGHSKIIEEIRQSGLRWLPSLPAIKFVNLYRNAHLLIGNSSSGIHEAASMKIPSINIGTRQQGRERAMNVLDVGYRADDIFQAIRKALYDEDFRAAVKNVVNPYGDGHSAEKIVKVLRNIQLSPSIVQKKFYE